MIQWTESIEIAAPVDEVRTRIHDQNHLMQWSAWPDSTGYTCAVEGDGVSPGSQIVFRDANGGEKGRQTLVAVEANVVRNQLRNQGPGGRVVEPRVDFLLEQIDGGNTRVTLDFAVTPPVPAFFRPLARRYLSLSIRPVHVEDLARPKRYVESAVAS